VLGPTVTEECSNRRWRDGARIVGDGSGPGTRRQQAFEAPPSMGFAMDEKTEALRDIFIDTTGADTVTERQEETPGSLTRGDDGVTDEHLVDLVERMRARFTFRSELETDALVTVLRGFFDGAADADLADDLGTTPEEVFDARMDLHLVTDADRTPVDDAVRRLVVDGADLETCVETVDADPATVRRAYRVVESETAAARASHRFRDEFVDRLSDEDLSTRLASDARRDGLKDATEDLETDVSL
jgi:hypothetical protein